MLSLTFCGRKAGIITGLKPSLGRFWSNRVRYLCKDMPNSNNRSYCCAKALEKEEVQENPSYTNLLNFNPGRLLKISKQLRKRNELKTVAAEQGITGKLFDELLTSFSDLLQKPEDYKDNASLIATIESIAEGTAHIDSLFPHFINHAHKCHPMLYVMPKLMKISNLTSPAQWYPAARSMKRHFIIHAGPTNSGKTHHALNAFFLAKSAVYCAPLRMLAAEIFQRSNEKGVACDLVTGEQRRYASGSSEELSGHVSCTVEMASTAIGTKYDVAVIDEAQMVRDKERGGAWTRAILGVPAKEIHLCGEVSIIPLIKKIVKSTGDTLEIKNYERLTPLVPLSKSLQSDYKHIKPGDCVVGFSRNDMFNIKKEIEKATLQSCAIVYGALPPANRQEQAKLFNSTKSHVNCMVATDAIGMGLNLQIKRIVFYTLQKRDGQSTKFLTSSQVKQIAGRAGRYGKFNRGEVTTFTAKDLPTLHKFLSFSIPDIKRAGLTPVYEHLELFSNHLPKLKLHDLLLVFSMTTKLDDTYFLCETAMQERMDKAEAISALPLELKDAFKLSMTPVSTRNPYIKKIFCEFAKYVCEKKPLEYTDLQKLLKWPFPHPDSPTTMLLWEDTHEALHLYLWLGQRYPDYFSDVAEVRSMQEYIEKVISKSLSSRTNLFKLNPLKLYYRKSNEDDPLILPLEILKRSLQEKQGSHLRPDYGQPFIKETKKHVTYTNQVKVTNKNETKK